MPSVLEDVRSRTANRLEQVKGPLADGVTRSLRGIDRVTAKAPYPRDAVAAPIRRLESATEQSFVFAERLLAAEKSLVLGSFGAVVSFVERPLDEKPAPKPRAKATRKPKPVDSSAA